MSFSEYPSSLSVIPNAGSILVDRVDMVRSDRIGKPFRENAPRVSYNQIRVGQTGMNTSAANAFSLQITMFGPLHVVANGNAISRPSKKALCLLTLLGLRAGRPVDRTWLAATLWPEADLNHGLSNLRQMLAELRKSLGEQAGRLRSGGSDSITLDLDGAWIDAIVFDEYVRAGGRGKLMEAVELYKAPLLEDWLEEWVIPERQARQQACLDALQSLAQLSRDSGDLASMVRYCREASKIDPLSDDVHRRLMEALEESGDRNASIQAYHDYSDRLERTLDLSPGETTTKVYRRIQRALRSGDGSRLSAASKEESRPSVLGNIPPQNSDLVGREDECDEVAALLRRSRLVTLTGFGGIGKTRLGLEVAARVGKEYEDGAWLIALSSITDGKLVRDQIARTLGLPEQEGSELADRLRNKKMLLVLDNCEHLLAEVDRVASSVLRACPGVRILATSRTALGITGEIVFVVPALLAPNSSHLKPNNFRSIESFDAVRLYVQRGKAVDPGFELNESNVFQVGVLCSRLEGIPLAIELAAAYVATVSAEKFATDLGPLVGESSSQGRHQTLRQTLDWSFNLLDEPEQTLFGRLSVFVGGWRLAAAEIVCSDPLEQIGSTIHGQEVVTILSSLVDKSLVVYHDDPLEGRYSFLEVVRQYASEELDRLGESAIFEKKHVEWTVGSAEEAGLLLRGPEQSSCLRRLDEDQNNFRAALERCKTDNNAEAAMRICFPLSRYWLMRNSVGEGRRHLSWALESEGGQARSQWRANALVAAAMLAGRQADYEIGRVFAEEGLSIRRELGDVRGVATVGGALGNMAYAMGDYHAAHRFFSDSRAVLLGLGLEALATMYLGSTGMIACAEGNYEEARLILEEACDRFRQIGDAQGLSWLLCNLGSVETERGALERATELFEEAKAISENQAHLGGVASVLLGQSIVARRRGKLELAKHLAEDSISISKEIGDSRVVAEGLLKLAQIANASDEFSYSEKCLHESLSLSRKIRDRPCEVECLATMAHLAWRQGSYLEAKTLAWESLALCHQIPRKIVVASNLELLAASEMYEGATREAVELWATVDSLRRKMEAPRAASEQESYETELAEAKRRLPKEEFSAAWFQGEGRSWLEAEDAVRLKSMGSEHS